MAEIPIQRKERRNIWPILLALVVLLVVLWFLFGRRRGMETAAAPSDSTAVSSRSGATTDSSAGTTSNGVARSSAGVPGGGIASEGGPPGGQLTDEDIIGMIHAVNQGAIASGNLAATKASNGAVKALARDVVKAHQALDEKGTKLTNADVTSGSSPLTDSVRSAIEAATARLQSTASGAAFDRAYLAAQLTGDQSALDFLQRARSAARNADLKQAIEQAIPEVQNHLERARALQAKVGP